MKNFSRLIVLIISLFVLVSCASPKTITVEEIKYVPVYMDISEPVGLLYATRPNTLPDFPEESDDDNYPVLVALAYKQFGEQWMDYSFRLEDYIEHLKSALAEPVDGI